MKKLLMGIIILMVVLEGSASVFADPIALPDDDSVTVVSTKSKS